MAVHTFSIGLARLQPLKMKQLELIIDDRYQLTRRIGGGSFGQVYEGLDLETKQDVAVKLEDASVDPSLLESEVEVYKELCAGIGIPRVHWHGFECEYNVMVLDLLGPSLEDLFNYCNRRFSLKTVLMLADQLLSRLQYIHFAGMIHRDIKPEHFLMGTGRRGNQLFITDFGLAWSTFAATARWGRGMIGTALFASIRGHTGEKQTEFDDLESLGYMLLYFLQGSLPWQALCTSRDQQEKDIILRMKTRTVIEELCEGTPKEFFDYFAYLRQDHGEQRADHAKLRRKLRSLFRREGYENDNVFDWTILKYKATLSSEG